MVELDAARAHVPRERDESGHADRMGIGAWRAGRLQAGRERESVRIQPDAKHQSFLGQSIIRRMAQISMTVNGKVRKADVEPRLLLVHFLREQLLLTGAHVGCDTSQCGACTVLIDGRSAKSCTVLAVQADGSEVTTIEGLATDGQLHPLQEGFWEEHGLQCGFCTPGMIMSAVEPAEGQPEAHRAGDPRRDLRQLLPLHGLSAHRQRHPARRGHTPAEGVGRSEEVAMADTSPVLPKLVGSARQAPRGSAADPGPRHVRRRREDRRHAAPRVQAQRHRARPHPLDRHERGARRWRASRRSSPARRSPNVLTPMPIGTPFPSPEHRAVAVDTVRYAGEPVAVVVATRPLHRPRRRRRDRRRVRPAAGRRRSRARDDRQADGHSPGVSEQPRACRSCQAARACADGKTVDDSAIDKAFAEAEVVISQRMVNHRLVPNAIEPRGVVAHYEPGKDTMTIWSSTQNPHILRTMIAAMIGLGRGPGPRHRAGGRRRLRRKDQHLRRGVRRRRDLEAAWACR